MKQTHIFASAPGSKGLQQVAFGSTRLCWTLLLALTWTAAWTAGCADNTRTASTAPESSGSTAPSPGQPNLVQANPVDSDPVESDSPTLAQDPPKSTTTPVFTYEVVARYPHDRGAYTQGLIWYDGKLFESTGQFGESTLRHVELETGKVLKKRDLPRQVFGEGLAEVNGIFYMLTWKAGQAFLFDTKTLRPLSYTYAYPGDGWGLTSCEEGLVMSDGTATIRFLEPKGMKPIREIQVTDKGRLIDQLNELEWIDGEIWANVWKLNRIARIDPTSGKVNAWVDMTGLLGAEPLAEPVEEVLNGIAYDTKTKRLFMTGKRWPYLYHVELREKK